ncbi:hypothetical protein RintRC_1024 [Richelia intracellularis]|nr:hypothetical protein RintRC_1024 [Richelia intracellularis]
MALAPDNQDTIHNNAQKPVTFTTKLDALTLPYMVVTRGK